MTAAMVGEFSSTNTAAARSLTLLTKYIGYSPPSQSETLSINRVSLHAGEALGATPLDVSDFHDLLASAARNPTINFKVNEDTKEGIVLLTVQSTPEERAAVHLCALSVLDKFFSYDVVQRFPDSTQRTLRRQGKRRREPEQTFLTNIKVRVESIRSTLQSATVTWKIVMEAPYCAEICAERFHSNA